MDFVRKWEALEELRFEIEVEAWMVSFSQDVTPFYMPKTQERAQKSETSFRLPAIGLFGRTIGMQLVGADRPKHRLFLEISGSKIGESLRGDLEMISIGCLALRISGGFETCLKRRAPHGIFSSM